MEVEGQTLKDTDLAKLASMPALTRLELRQAAITSLQPLLPILPRLHFLMIPGSLLADESLGDLHLCSQLFTLDLRGAPVTDKGIKQLTGLGNLTRLGLAETQISDAAIDSLIEIKYLENVDLSGTRTTAEGRARLIKARPGLGIEFHGLNK